MVANHYRWDFIGLSTDTKPTAENPKVTDGSTYYESNTSKLYVWFKDRWYEKTVEGGGGGGADSGITLLTQADVTGQDPDGTDVIELWKIPSGIYRYNITENDTYYIVGNMQYDNENDSYYVDFQFDRDGIVVVYHESNLSSYTVISTESTISFNNVNDNGYTNPDLIDTNYPFEGTDGTFNGKSGIVPAPLEGDGNKFLCSDGTWKEAGGGIKILSNNDFNYDNGSGSFDSVAMWLLPDGMYFFPADQTATPVIGCLDGNNANRFNTDINQGLFFGFLKINTSFWMFTNPNTQDNTIYVNRPVYFCKINSVNGWYTLDSSYQLATRSELSS